ncbi:cytochrome P450 [Lepidopterella palustris CBS 459.81]|uniref:Cytochrome P450 n=1 Tax=Lepidopterella palustris CBS 459.81 TaxID=1314670 RepID=A0A8E2EKB7_9PEZI|nr:cytochrome P450 [Lepidopterella palustris CBS 459.81]
MVSIPLCYYGAVVTALVRILYRVITLLCHFVDLFAWNILKDSLSVGIYRRFFHRLRHFPGPFGASLTKFWAFYQVTKGNYFKTVADLHREHGDFVRVGPRELDVCNLSAVNTVFGSTSPCLKGAWYDGTHMGDPSTAHVQLEKTHEGHGWKRRIWDVALASKSLRDYEPRVLRYVDKLLDAVKRESQKNDGVVDMGLYFSFFTFDVMGDLAFGESFHMLEDGKTHDYMKIVQGYAVANALICTIPWIASIFPWLPKLEAVESLYRFARKRVIDRLPFGEKPTDVFSYLLREDRVTKQKYTQKQLDVECVALIIGGSDTTSSSLASISYFLMTHPEKLDKLKAEIHAYDGPLDHANLAKFPYLNAVIKESLRLLPPIRSGMMHRVTPPEGITIEGTFIPGNVNIGIGSYEVQHDPRYWGKPDDFIPERWLGEGPEPCDRNAYLVFSYGPFSCVGKHLAYMELCNVVAAFIRAFDMELDPKYDVSSYIPSLKDAVISSRAYLPVVLKPREQKA